MKTFKAALAAMLSLALMMSLVLVPSAAVDTLGDLNGDGRINLSDAFRVYAIASGGAPTEQELFEGDIDFNGKINLVDAFAIYKAASGGENNLPARPQETVTYINMLDIKNVDPESMRNTTASMVEGGSMLIESTGEGEIGLTGPGVYDVSVLKYTHVVIDSDVPFKISFYDAANDRWMTSDGDFYPDFGCASSDMAAAKGVHNVGLYTYNCYAWGGQELPETVEMTSIYIYPQAAGKILVKHLALCDTKACGENCQIGTDELPKPPVEIEEREMGGEYMAITGTESTAAAGDIVTVSFSIPENSYITNGEFNIFWDPEKLEVQETNEDDDLIYMAYINSGIFKSSWMKLGVAVNEGQYNFGFAGASATSLQGATKGGIMFSMDFKVLDGWTGTEEIILAIPELCSNAEVEVDNVYNTYCDYYVSATVTVE